MSRSTRIRLTVAVAAALLAAAPLASPAAAAAGDLPTPPPWLTLTDGMSRSAFSSADALVEQVAVETPVDTDGDGLRDRVHLQLYRPRETETLGIKVPVIFNHSPYRFGTGGGVNHDVDVDVLPQEPGAPPAATGGSRPGGRSTMDATLARPPTLVERWVPRGYAVVLGESLGTGGSDGCPTVGDQAEMLGAKAIIDWLNGRARGWDEHGSPAVARWTTGAVGMIGTSYDGTLANMVATSGVPGLRTIVGVSAIASWYDYYRANGLVRAPHSGTPGVDANAFQGEDMDVLATFTQGPTRTAHCAAVTAALTAGQDRTTGDFSAFWHQRDWLHRAAGVRASVLVVHGLADYNVMTKAFASWWTQLASNDVARRIWLHRGGHGGPADDADYQVLLHRWFDHWLFGVDNGVTIGPTAWVQRPDGGYDTYPDWPVPGTRPVTLRLGAEHPDSPGTLTTGSRGAGRTPQTFVDQGRDVDTDTMLLPGPDTSQLNRLVYRSAVLLDDAHLSGTSQISLRASVDNRGAANLTAVLVDYPPPGSAEPPVMVTRGWTDPQNWRSLTGGTPVRPGQVNPLRWDLQPDDYVFPAGHRIGLVIVSTDQQFTLRPTPGTELTVHPADSALVLPLVGGLARTGP